MKPGEILLLEQGDMWILHFPDRANQTFECLDQSFDEWFELSPRNRFSGGRPQMFVPYTGNVEVDCAPLTSFNLMIEMMNKHPGSFGAIYRWKNLKDEECFGSFAILREVIS